MSLDAVLAVLCWILWSAMRTCYPACCLCSSHPGTGKYFTVSSVATGLTMQVEGKVIEAGSKVVLAKEVVSKVKGHSTVAMNQQFCCDEMTGTIRSQFRYYCLDIDQGTSCIQLLFFLFYYHQLMYSVLWLFWLHVRKDIWPVYNGLLYLSITPKFNTKVLHQTTGLKPN